MNTKTPQNQTPIQIRIRNVQLERKTVLYGPNGAGKSFIISSILTALTTRRSVEGLVEVEVETVRPMSIVAIDESGVKQLGTANIFSINELSFADWGGVAIVNPATARQLSVEVYYNLYYDPDRGWIPLTHMSYGRKRRLAIEAALLAGNVVLIENFEAGLHVDAVVDLIKQIAESDAVVVVLETHSGLVLRAAQRYGLAIYYVEPLARLRRIERLDDPQLFAGELSAWNAVVV
jgi:ABC-type branched-subunit amino acid transport system ATPase component